LPTTESNLEVRKLPTYRRLKPGPGQSPSDVSSHQRERIHRAMIQLVAESGYGSVTVRKLAKLAGVSTGTFYSHFDGKEDCFVATCSLEMDEICEQVLATRSPARDREAQFSNLVEAFANSLLAAPEGARMALVDSFRGGPAALTRIRRFETALDEVVRRTLDRRGSRVSTVSTGWVAAGLLRVARKWTLERQEGELVGALRDWNGASALVDAGGSPPAQKPTIENLTPPVIDQVAVDDRDLVLIALIKLAKANGYWSLSIAQVCSAAGVSAVRFKRHFRSLEECYAAAMRTLASRYFEDITDPAAAATGPMSWRAGVEREVANLCRTVAGDPGFAKLLFLDIVNAGVEGLRCREEMIGELATAWRSVIPVSIRPSEVAAEASMAALWEAIRRDLELDRAPSLDEKAATWTRLLLASTRDKKHSSALLD
jgi:AcrR family transcriptional regulator